MVRPGNRTSDIVAPQIGFTELRPDLDEFETPVVLSSPSFDNSHQALLERGAAWFDRGMDAREATQHAQLLSGKHLGGFALQRLAGQAEEAYRQYQSSQPQSRFYTREQGE